MEWELGTLASILALPKPQLPFCGSADGNETLEPQECNSAEIKLFTVSHPPVGTSGNSYSNSTPITPLPIATGWNEESFPPITKPQAIGKY